MLCWIFGNYTLVDKSSIPSLAPCIELVVLPYQCEQKACFHIDIVAQKAWEYPDAAWEVLSYTTIGQISMQDDLPAFQGAFLSWQSSVQQFVNSETGKTETANLVPNVPKKELDHVVKIQYQCWLVIDYVASLLASPSLLGSASNSALNTLCCQEAHGCA